MSKLFREDWELHKLRLLHADIREVTVLVDNPKHVVNFEWKDNSKEILYGSTVILEL